MFTVPEVHRAGYTPSHPMYSSPRDGNNGVFTWATKPRIFSYVSRTSRPG